MQVCDYCGIEIEGTPVRRKKHVYCSKTCAEEHEFEVAEVDEEELEYEVDDDDDDDRSDN
jgi:hypothetical protein